MKAHEEQTKEVKLKRRESQTKAKEKEGKHHEEVKNLAKLVILSKFIF